MKNLIKGFSWKVWVAFGLGLAAFAGLITLLQFDGKESPSQPAVTSPKNSDEDVKYCKRFKELPTHPDPVSEDEFDKLVMAFKDSEVPELNQLAILTEEISDRVKSGGPSASDVEILAIGSFAYEGCLALGINILEGE